MLKYDKRDLINLFDNGSGIKEKLFFSKDLYFEFNDCEDEKDNMIKISLFYKNKKIYTDYFSKNIEDKSKLYNIINSKIKFMLYNLCYNFIDIQHDKDFHGLKKVIKFIINRKTFDNNNEFLINNFGNILIISVEYDFNDRQIFVLSLDSNNKLNYRFAKIKNELNEKFSVYNSYEFILKECLFKDFINYNELVAEITYELTL